MVLKKTIDEINEALGKGKFITLFCTCAVSYSGRAESYLPFGDRMIVIKQDRAVLIHQPVNGNPINYLRAPASIEFEMQTELDSKEKEHISFHATSKDDEIFVEITKVHKLTTIRLEDGQMQDLAGSEAEMSDMLKEQPHLISDDFIPLSREEHTKYGFIDVFGHLGDGTLAIIECKRYTAGLSAVTQLRRYVEKMKAVKGIETVTGIIAAPAITANALAMLQDWHCAFVRIDPPKRYVNKNKKQKKIEQFF